MCEGKSQGNPIIYQLLWENKWANNSYQKDSYNHRNDKSFSQKNQSQANFTEQKKKIELEVKKRKNLLLELPKGLSECWK